MPRQEIKAGAIDLKQNILGLNGGIMKIRYLAFLSFILTLLLINNLPASNGNLFIQTISEGNGKKQIYISLGNSNCYNKIDWEQKISEEKDTLKIEFENIDYCAIFSNEMPSNKFPIFGADSLFVTIDFANRRTLYQSKNYQYAYTIFDSLKTHLQILESNVYRVLSDTNLKDSLISIMDISLIRTKKLINENIKSKNIRSLLLSYYATELLKLKSELYLLLFSQGLVSANDIPDIEKFLPSQHLLKNYYLLVDFNTLIHKAINLGYLRCHNIKPKAIFLSIQKKLKTVLSRDYYPIAEIRLIGFLLGVFEDELTLKFLKQKTEEIKKEFIKTHIYIKDDLERIISLINIKSNLGKGAFVPNVRLINLDSNYFDLQNLKGKPTILVFWGTWCGPCLEEIDFLLENKKSLRLENFQLVFIALEYQNFNKWKKFVLEKEIPGIHLYAENQFMNPEIKKFGITGVPFHIIITTEFKIFDYNAPQFRNIEYYSKLLEKLSQ